MPLYEIQHEATGERRDILLPIAARDSGVPPGFKRIPAAPGIVGTRGEGPDFATQVKQGLYDQEQKQGSRFQADFSKTDLARIWERPLNNPV